MVRIQNIVVLALAQLILAAPPAEPTAADIGTFDSGRCKTHTLYCGHTLKRLGWSSNLIQSRVALSDWNDGHVPRPEQVDQSLFKCGTQGAALVWVNNRTPCHCVDAGSGNSDYCG